MTRARTDPPARLGALAVAATLAAGGGAAIAGGCNLIAGLSDHQPYPVVQITAGKDHACALLRTGEVWCWGANDTGQLGHRTEDGGECSTACPPAPVEGIEGAVQVSAGAGFTCAVLGSGEVQCWGRDAARELGRTTNTLCGTDACDPDPAPVAGVSGAVQVSAGGDYACARTASGTVYCWGDNTYGQLGKGDLGGMSPPTPVGAFTGAVDVAASLTGSNTCAATTEGKVFCWGLDLYGGTGRAPKPTDPMSTTSPARPCTPAPYQVGEIKGAVSVRTGDYGACAGLASGDWWCWGYGGLGNLGLPMPGSDQINAPARITAMTGIAVLDMRDSTTCAADAPGAVSCWGRSGVGALGPESGTASSCDQGVACQRAAQRVGLDSVTQIAAGVNLSLALRTDGTVMAWGVNDKGQLGHAPKTLKDAPCPADAQAVCNVTPRRVEGLPP